MFALYALKYLANCTLDSWRRHLVFESYLPGARLWYDHIRKRGFLSYYSAQAVSSERSCDLGFGGAQNLHWCAGGYWECR